MTFSDWQVLWIQEELIEIIGDAIVEEMSDTSVLHSTHAQTVPDMIIRACTENAIRRAVTKEALETQEG